MRVGLNVLFLVPGSVGGSEEATVAVLRELAGQAPDGIDYTVFGLESFGKAHPDLAERFPTQLIPLGGGVRPFRVAAESTWLAAEARKRGLDLVHHFNGTMPAVRTAPGVVTVHDLQPFDMPQNFHPVKRAYLHLFVPRSVRRARLVLTPSEFVRRTLLERFELPDGRVRATPWGVEPPNADVSVAEVQAHYRLPHRWFVFPAVTWPHKNHLMLIRAFAAVAAKAQDVTLVLTGAPGSAENDVTAEIERFGLGPRVRRIGRIPRADMLAVVRGAVALTFPSRYEGFGLPVLEAMSMGTPVLAGDAASLPEVAGDAGLLIDTDDTDEWVTAMLRMLEDPVERDRLADAGRARAAAFPWSTTGALTIQAHRDVLAQGGP